MKGLKYLVIATCLLLFACSNNDDPRQVFKQGDYEKAYSLWLPLAKSGDADAQNYLGIHYYMGLGVKRDYVKALKWYELAARAGHADAQSNYGDMINYGLGVQQDYYKAFIWYFSASQQGNDKAKRHIDTIAASGKLTPNQQMHAKIEANNYIVDPEKRFMSHDTYIEKH